MAREMAKSKMEISKEKRNAILGLLVGMTVNEADAILRNVRDLLMYAAVVTTNGNEAVQKYSQLSPQEIEYEIKRLKSLAKE